MRWAEVGNLECNGYRLNTHDLVVNSGAMNGIATRVCGNIHENMFSQFDFYSLRKLMRMNFVFMYSKKLKETSIV